MLQLFQESILLNLHITMTIHLKLNSLYCKSTSRLELNFYLIIGYQTKLSLTHTDKIII